MKTQADLRRRLNADRRLRFGSPGRVLALLCECTDAECRRTVLLSPAEYDERQAQPIIHPEHLAPLTGAPG